MQGEFDYFAARSGLSAGSLTDHMLAYYKAQNGSTVNDLGWQMLTFFQTQNGSSAIDLRSQMLTYYRTTSGRTTGSVEDCMSAVFLAPPTTVRLRLADITASGV